MFPRGFSLLTIAFVLVAPLAASAQTPPTFSDIAYSSEHFRHKLDIYLPQLGKTTYALVIYIHGGGWIVGDKSEVQPFVDSLLARGFAVASINYRYSYHAPFPAQIHDCKGALRFLRGNAVLYSLDPDRVAVFGESSGAHLAALLATSSGVASLEGTVGGNRSQPSSVNAAGDFFGPTDMFELGSIPPHNHPGSIVSRLFNYPIQEIIDNIDNPAYAELVALVDSANPASHATADDPSFQIAHGLDDELIPPSQSILLHDALTKAGVPSELRLVPGWGHELPLSEFEITFDFFVKELIVSPCVAADLNCDQLVNVDDLLILLAAWGSCPGASGCAGDISADGLVNVDDLLQLLASWTLAG